MVLAVRVRSCVLGCSVMNRCLPFVLVHETSNAPILSNLELFTSMKNATRSHDPNTRTRTNCKNAFNVLADGIRKTAPACIQASTTPPQAHHEAHRQHGSSKDTRVLTASTLNHSLGESGAFWIQVQMRLTEVFGACYPLRPVLKRCVNAALCPAKRRITI